MKLNSQEPETRKKTTDHPRAFQIACVVLSLLVIFVCFQGIQAASKKTGTIDEQKQELALLNKDIKEAKKQVDALPKQPETEGQAAKRNDKKAAEAFLKELLTWADGDAYQAVRDTLMAKYHVAETDALLTTFMPKLSKEEIGDNNMSYDSAQITLVNGGDGNRSYLALCSVKNRVDGHAGNGQVAVFYTIDEAGTVSNISAYALVS